MQKQLFKINKKYFFKQFNIYGQKARRKNAINIHYSDFISGCDMVV